MFGYAGHSFKLALVFLVVCLKCLRDFGIYYADCSLIGLRFDGDGLLF